MVYVDNMQAPFDNMIMCHMLADTRDELFDMVDKIGVKRKWIQDRGTEYEHFDICLSKRKLAIKFGAKEIGHNELHHFLQDRKKRNTDEITGE